LTFHAKQSNDGAGAQSLKMRHPVLLAVGARLFKEDCLRNPFSTRPESEKEKAWLHWFRMFRPTPYPMRTILSEVSSTPDDVILAAGRWLGPEGLQRAERFVALRLARRARRG
jgi:hypothetical protein